MRNILFIVCFLFSFGVFSQQIHPVSKDSVVEVPTSIFTANLLDYQLYNEKLSPLGLTGYKFLITDYYHRGVFSGNIHIDLRNFGRYASYEDITDNYNKANLYKFDVSKNTNHFVWTMWDTHLQKQWQKSREQSEN